MKVLLVKLSSLGDVVHTLPVVQDLRGARPGVEIDWVVEQSFAPLLAHSQGLGRVIPCEIRRWLKAPLAATTRAGWRAFKAQLQAEAYDAVIDLQGLTKSALVARLARLAPGGRRYALANRTEGSGYEAPTRWLADVAVPVQPHIHAVQRGRLLCAQALGFQLPPAVDFGFRVAPSELARDAANTVLFVHGTSRPDKEWPLANWVALGRRLIAAGYGVALPHASASELANSEKIAQALAGEQRPASSRVAPPATVWPRLSLDALTERMAACRGVVGVDSGLSHIAVALDLPHVQLYNFDTAWRTGPLPAASSETPPMAPRQRSVFAQPVPAVETVWQAWLACSQTDPVDLPG